jgi:hypothetical protein
VSEDRPEGLANWDDEPELIGLGQAVDIATRHRIATGYSPADRRCRPFMASSRKPPNLLWWTAEEQQPAWYVWFPSTAELALVSSSVVVVSKATGQVILEGSAGDEG